MVEILAAVEFSGSGPLNSAATRSHQSSLGAGILEVVSRTRWDPEPLPSSCVLALFALFAINLKAVSLGLIRRRGGLLLDGDDPESWFMLVSGLGKVLTLGNLLLARYWPDGRMFSGPALDVSDECCCRRLFTKA